MAKRTGGYQGWKNWETWNVALWFDNDYGLYQMYREYAQRRRFTAQSAKGFVVDAMPDGTPDFQSEARRRAGDEDSESEQLTGLERLEIAKMYNRVSWTEIARNFNES